MACDDDKKSGESIPSSANLAGFSTSDSGAMMTPDQARMIARSGEDNVVAVLLAHSAQSAQQNVQIARLERKIAQLSKNSSNSSKRPSSDDLTKPPGKKPPVKTQNKRKIGGQPGHTRHERAPFSHEQIDEFHDYIQDACPDCCGSVDLTGGEVKVIQQLDLVDVPLRRIEHRSYPVRCRECDHIHYLPFPSELIKAGLFSARLTAFVAYQHKVCHASFSTIRVFIRDILGETVSRGYLRKLIAKVSEALADPYEELLAQLPLSTVVNVDETGHKENGKPFWTWVFRTELFVLFKIDKSRGSKVVIDVLGEHFDGVLGCDYFSAYCKYMKDFDITVQFCLAHLIRNVRYLLSLPEVESKAYGERLLSALRELFKVIHQADELSESSFNAALEKARSKVLSAAQEDLPSRLDSNGKEHFNEVHNLAKRFRLHGHAYFQFITTPEVDPTNNVAEQAVRFIVIDRHISQGTRSKAGRESSERLWTIIGTCAIQGRSAYQFILAAVDAFFRGKSPPSLLPAPT